MLVLRRRVGEAIVIGGDVEVEIIEISRTRVKLGVKAARSICVMRRRPFPSQWRTAQRAGILGSHGNNDAEILRWLLKRPEARADK